MNVLLAQIKSNIKLSFPIILGQLGTVAMGITDTLFVGKIGKAELAAGGVCNSVFFFFCIFGIGLISGISPLVSREDGASNNHLGYRFLAAGIRAAFFAGLFIWLASWLFSNYFNLLHQSEAVNQISPVFLSIISISSIPLLIFLAIKSFADGRNFTSIGMLITFGGVALNWILNEVLIFGWGPLPPMGFNGSATATLITRILSAIAIIIWLYMGPLKPTQPIWLAKMGAEFKELIKIGFPSAFQYFFEVGAFSGAAVMIGYLGSEYSAAHNIALQIAGVTYMAALAFSIAGSIQVGHAVGENNIQKVKTAGKAALWLILMYESLTCLTIVLLKEPLATLFTADPEVIKIAVDLLLVAAFFQWSDGLQCVALGLLRARGDVNIPTILTFISYWLIALPFGAYMIFYEKSAVGFWIALLIALSFSAILLSTRFFLLKPNVKIIPTHGK